MVQIQRTFALVAVALAVAAGGCAPGSGTVEEEGSAGLAPSRGAHDRDGGGYEQGEESGAELALDARYDEVRNGARLLLAYDAQSNSFIGTVENTTDRTLKRVRVEVHLSNGKELGPTTPADLAPGEKREVRLPATETGFDGWVAHPEVGSGEGVGEHGGEGSREHGGEGAGEHGGEGAGEHGGEGRGEHGEGRSG